MRPKLSNSTSIAPDSIMRENPRASARDKGIALNLTANFSHSG